MQMNNLKGSTSSTQPLKGSIAGGQSLTGGSAINVAVTPNITIGTVTTLEAGAEVIVELDETSTRMNPVLNFGIPEGKEGAKGKAGSVKFVIVNELPTENIDESAIYMKPSNNPETQNTYEEYIYVNGSWEGLGSANVDVNLEDYIKNTDYASNSKAGLVKGNVTYGIYANETNGTLSIVCASENQMDSKTDGYRPLASKNIDYAVKLGMTTNTLEWTEEEKSNACDLINAVKRVEYSQAATLPSGSDGGYYGRVYAVDKVNEQNSIPICSQNRNYTLPIRDHNGNFYVANPTIAYHCANKQYVDNAIGDVSTVLDAISGEVI